MLAYSYLRFSTSEQAKGDSIRRQAAARDAYLTRTGMTLDTSFILPPERAKSGFFGTNRLTGSLRLFLDACESKRIKSGSWLIVENLDRLTREEAGVALTLFQGILGHGISIVTLTPEMEFPAGQMDFGKWVIALAEMCRGHSESLIKSKRGKDNWEQKRTKVHEGPITARRPSWLDIDANRFVLNPKKARTVRAIFKLAANGYGTSYIAKKLNREKVPVISKARHWFDSYVYRILTNRATVGEYQPQKRDGELQRDGKKKLVPVGLPVKSYFPRVVTDTQFAKAQIAIRSRRTCGGRVSGEARNLFTSLVCTNDGTPYALRDRNSHRYLLPNTVTAGITEGVNGVPYPHFEHVMLSWLRELRVDFGGVDNTAGLEARKSDLTANIEELQAGIRKGGKSVARLVGLLEEKETELSEVAEALQLASIPKTNQLNQTRNLISRLAECPPHEREKLRLQLKQQIRFLVKSIEVRSEGVVRNPNKRHYLTITFSDTTIGTRRLWFDTSRKGIERQGLWTPDGAIPFNDFAAMMEMLGKEESHVPAAV